jgi:hypothetical protein
MQAATTHIHGQHGSGCGCHAAQEIWVKKTAVVLRRGGGAEQEAMQVRNGARERVSRNRTQGGETNRQKKQQGSNCKYVRPVN